MRKQSSYFKTLDSTVKFNYQVVVNLSATVRQLAENTQATFQEIATKLDFSIRQMAMVIRELEFALTQLKISIDELIGAMQSVVLGKIPVNLLTPRVLQYINNPL
jgi:hypothetical protein